MFPDRLNSRKLHGKPILIIISVFPFIIWLMGSWNRESSRITTKSPPKMVPTLFVGISDFGMDFFIFSFVGSLPTNLYLMGELG